MENPVGIFRNKNPSISYCWLVVFPVFPDIFPIYPLDLHIKKALKNDLEVSDI